MEVVRRQRGLLGRQNAFSSNYTGVARHPFYGRVTSRQPIDRGVTKGAASPSYSGFRSICSRGNGLPASSRSERDATRKPSCS